MRIDENSTIPSKPFSTATFLGFLWHRRFVRTSWLGILSQWRIPTVSSSLRPPNLTSKLLQTGSLWVEICQPSPSQFRKKKPLGSWLHSHHRWNPTLPATSLFCTSFLFSLAPATKPRKEATHIMHWRNRTTSLFHQKSQDFESESTPQRGQPLWMKASKVWKHLVILFWNTLYSNHIFRNLFLELIH